MHVNRAFNGLEVTGEDVSGQILFVRGKRPPEPDCAVDF